MFCLCVSIVCFYALMVWCVWNRLQCFNLRYTHICSRNTNCYHFRMPNETCSFNNRFKSLSGIHLMPGIWQPTYQNQKRYKKTTRKRSGGWKWRSNAEEFILFTFCRNLVMIASYKIDEICHKNEDVCFYVYIENEIEVDRVVYNTSVHFWVYNIEVFGIHFTWVSHNIHSLTHFSSVKYRSIYYGAHWMYM